uniref:Uncharacterized protein n=1 Tax=Oryza nivara TaxID=4536 RepID=A0A0E0JCI3_ORYNI
MLRPPHSAEKGMGDDGMLCAECSGERARATTACSAQSAQGRTSHRIGNGAEVLNETEKSRDASEQCVTDY